MTKEMISRTVSGVAVGLKGAGEAEAAQMRRGHDQHEDERRHVLRVVRHEVGEAGESAAKVLAKDERADRNRRGKADRGRAEAGAESDHRMVDPREEIVLAAGTGQRRRQLRIAKRAAQSAARRRRTHSMISGKTLPVSDERR